MSKYTTEVRYICESYAGLTESEGYDSIDEIVTKAYPKIFDTENIPTFEGETPEHRALLFKKILLYYYTREIGYETVGLWKLKLNQRLMNIMPYYNQLYESELIKFDPLKNVDNTVTHEGEYNDDETEDNIRNTTDHDVTDYVSATDSEENVILRHDITTTHGNDTTAQGNDTRTNVINTAGDKWTLFSDTPQGGIDGIANASSGQSVGNNSYLTSATHEITTPDAQTTTDVHGTITNTYGNVVEAFNANGDKRDTTTGDTDVEAHTISDKAKRHVDDLNKNKKGTDEYENKEMGKIGVETYSEMLMKFRKTFLNIDKMVIDELESLFMQLW